MVHVHRNFQSVRINYPSCDLWKRHVHQIKRKKEVRRLENLSSVPLRGNPVFLSLLYPSLYLVVRLFVRRRIRDAIDNLSTYIHLWGLSIRIILSTFLRLVVWQLVTPFSLTPSPSANISKISAERTESKRPLSSRSVVFM